MRCRVKICGVTSREDAVLAARLGADAIGLNFYPRSPRRIDEPTARAILDDLPPFTAPVMLAVDEPWSTTAARLERLRPMTVQLHGHELSPCPAAPWVPAFAVKDDGSLRTIEAFLDRCRRENNLPAAILIDAHVPGEFGGTGQVAPWRRLVGFDPGVPLILAGGLNPTNVAEAVRMVQPYMVDVASGVESAPGRKDPDKVRRFLAAVFEAG